MTTNAYSVLLVCGALFSQGCEAPDEQDITGLQGNQSALSETNFSQAADWDGASIGETRPYQTAGNLAFAGDAAAPATALNCLPGHPDMHAAEYANDGYYGNGSTWIANSADAWVEVDLGAEMLIDGLRFGRDRLGVYDDRDPGQFTVSVATAPGAFSVVYQSSAHGFSGLIDGPETVGAHFESVTARYVRLQVSEMGAAIDEIEVFAPRVESNFPVRWVEGGSGFWNDQRYVQGDFDGDGAPDIARIFGGPAGETHVDVFVRAGDSLTWSSWAQSGLGQFWPTQRYMAADFDGDGDDDIVRIFDDGGTTTIDLLRSTGSDFAWQRLATQQGAHWPAQAFVAGDFDCDGTADLAKIFGDADATSVDVFVSGPAGMTMARWMTRQGWHADEMKFVAGDYDLDGCDDIAKVFKDANKASVDVLKSTGAVFEVERWLTRGGIFRATSWYVGGDFDGDGRDDFAEVDLTKTVMTSQAFLAGPSTFEPVQFHSGLSSATRVLAADFDQDGRAELAGLFGRGGELFVDMSGVSAPAGEVGQTASRWAHQQGGFWPGQHYFTGDFNGDGTADVARVWAHGNATSIDLHANAGTGLNAEPWVGQQGAHWAAQKFVQGDFDGDGLDDIAKLWASDDQTVIDVYRGGSDTFTQWRAPNGGHWDTQKFVAGDFNGDGRDDIAKIWADPQDQAIVDVYLSQGTSFGASTTWINQGGGGFWAEQVYITGDFDADGRDDIARIFGAPIPVPSVDTPQGFCTLLPPNVPGTGIDVFVSANGGFNQSHWTSRPHPFSPLQKFVAGNFDGVGGDDIVKVHNRGDGRVALRLFASDNGSFADRHLMESAMAFTSELHAAAGDFDRDGLDEVVTVYGDATPDPVAVALGIPTAPTTHMDVFGGQTTFDTDRIHFVGTQKSFTPGELAASLASEGLTLVNQPHLAPQQCTVLYMNRGVAGHAAQVGALVCARPTELLADVENPAPVARVVTGMVLGGYSPPGTQVEFGTGGAEATVELGGGVVTKVNIEGPNMAACASASPEMGCLAAGFDLFSASLYIGDSRGNGAGIGVSAGVGFKKELTYEDGVVGVKGDVALGRGVSYNASVNVNDLAHHGAAGYAVLDGGVAGPRSAAVDRINTSADDVSSAVGDHGGSLADTVADTASDAADVADDAGDVICGVIGC